jgi:hypothetical protein
MHKFSEKVQKNLVKKFHTLLGKAGINNDGKMSILAAYGVTTSKNLGIAELSEICDKIQAMMNSEIAEMDKWRKRTMAAIGGYLDVSGQKSSAELIKAIACRASGYETFNSIPKQRLNDVYNAFKNKQATFKNVEKLTAEDIPMQSMKMTQQVYA